MRARNRPRSTRAHTRPHDSSSTSQPALLFARWTFFFSFPFFPLLFHLPPEIQGFQTSLDPDLRQTSTVVNRPVAALWWELFYGILIRRKGINGRKFRRLKPWPSEREGARLNRISRHDFPIERKYNFPLFLFIHSSFIFVPRVFRVHSLGPPLNIEMFTTGIISNR